MRQIPLPAAVKNSRLARRAAERLRPPASPPGADTPESLSGDPELDAKVRHAVRQFKRIQVAGRAWTEAPNRLDRINAHLQTCLTKSGIDGGDVLEIGARLNPRLYMFPPPRYTYRVGDIEDFGGDVEVVILDITNCPELPDESYDVIVSVDVFEHVKEPWKAAAEIKRLLRPGGLVYTSTVFAWRYHPVPVDFWRYTPDALEFLFEGLETIDVGFDTTERRRDLRGKGKADRVPVDALGGFRENWRVFHAGRKPLANG